MLARVSKNNTHKKQILEICDQKVEKFVTFFHGLYSLHKH